MSVAKFSPTRHQHVETASAVGIMIVILFAISFFAMFTLLSRIE